MKTEQVSWDTQGAPLRCFNKRPCTNQLASWNYSLVILYFLWNRISWRVNTSGSLELKKKISAVLDMHIDGLLFQLANYLTAWLTQWPTKKLARQNGIIFRDSVEDTNIMGLRIDVSGHCCKCSEIIQKFSQVDKYTLIYKLLGS